MHPFWQMLTISNRNDNNGKKIIAFSLSHLDHQLYLEKIYELAPWIGNYEQKTTLKCCYCEHFGS